MPPEKYLWRAGAPDTGISLLVKDWGITYNRDSGSESTEKFEEEDTA